jgi:hypothetical protein
MITCRQTAFSGGPTARLIASLLLVYFILILSTTHIPVVSIDQQLAALKQQK